MAMRPAWAQEYETLQGVEVARPGGFVRAENTPALYSEDKTASIMVSVLPGPYSEVTKGFTRETLGEKGATLLQKIHLSAGEEPGLLILMRQTAQGTTYLKWVRAFGNEQRTAIVAGTVEAAHEQAWSATLRDAVSSSRWGTRQRGDPFAEVNFTLEPAPSLTFAERVGTALMFTKDGAVTPSDPSDPLYVAGVSPAMADIGDLAAFARERLKRTATLRDIRVQAEKTLEIDDLPGYELLGSAFDAKSGLGLAVYQAILAEPGTGKYFIFQGLVGAAQAQQYLDEFRRLTATFQRKRK
jgi:hypothetical protein